MGKRVALLGDSVFDNKAYVKAGEPDVAEQLNERFGEDSTVKLLAVDGHTTANISGQLRGLPADTTHIVISVGGNDGLEYLTEIQNSNDSVSRITESMLKIDELIQNFRADYRNMLESVLGYGRPTALCTIYDGCFPDDELQKIVNTILPIFNDVIFTSAIRNNLPVLNLKLICNEAADYANPIEPSARGGEKIARIIETVLNNHQFETGETTIYS